MKEKPSRPEDAGYLLEGVKEGLSDHSIDILLRKECMAILKPYSERKGRGAVFVMDTILAALNGSEGIQHSVSVGLMYGPLLQKFYGPTIGFFEGFIAGLVHDVGKAELDELFNSEKTFDHEERELAKDHVYYTYDYLRDYPILKWLVCGHHLSGQPHGDFYPENYREENTHMRSLHTALAVADKASASIEFRPELTKDEKEKRQTFEGLLKNIDRLYGWFPPKNSLLVRKQIDYAREIIQQKMVLTPYFPDRKIPINDSNLIQNLISQGNLKPDGSRLELNILNSPLRGAELSKLLIQLTKFRSLTPCNVLFEPVTNKKLEVLYKL